MTPRKKPTKVIIKLYGLDMPNFLGEGKCNKRMNLKFPFYRQM
jgi:hypothetical protein